MKILCVNAGSSSLKFQLYDMPAEISIIGGYVEKIGAPDSFYTIKYEGKKTETAKPIKDHAEAAKIMLEELINYGAVEDLEEIRGVGHRVLHGGEKYAKSVVIDEQVLKDIKDLTKLGPLHHPGNIAGIKAMQKALPNATQVAVFDTAFHQTIPKVQFMYPVPMEWYEKYGVRKYGFHGTSHKYITEVMQKKLGKEKVNLIVCHVGSGASITAVKDSKSYDTTMGLTPLDGLMMGTRSGSIDPSIIKYMIDEAGMTYDEVDEALNKKSGLKGVCGYNDNRDVVNYALNRIEVYFVSLYASRIIITSSLVGSTYTGTVESSAVIMPLVISLKLAIASFTSLLILIPNGAKPLMIDSRVSAPFSSTPAVNTMASTSPPSSR